jgi:hypothetical protein
MQKEEEKARIEVVGAKLFALSRALEGNPEVTL